MSDHKLLYIVTGSRDYPDPEQVRLFGRSLPAEAFLMEGECRDSPDVWAAEGFLQTHPPEQLLKRPAAWRPNGGDVNLGAGLERNDAMAAEGAAWKAQGHCVRVVAFWDTVSTGTPHMVRASRRAGLHVTTYKNKVE